VEDQWLAWARKLQGIAATGRHFARDDYDSERYVEIEDIAKAMLAALGKVPLERIQGLVHDHVEGYATPKIDVRGAVIEGERILLVRERCDGLWTLPGGYADVGISAGDNVVREIREEACIRVRARLLYSLRHKARHDYDPDVRDFYKLFFLCEATDSAVPQPGPETSDAAYFSLDELPPLSTGRVIRSDIEAAFECRRSASGLRAFD
jgi:ADP-ribose pyrophosphatase YjhB (NUDIX family)